MKTYEAHLREVQSDYDINWKPLKGLLRKGFSLSEAWGFISTDDSLKRRVVLEVSNGKVLMANLKENFELWTFLSSAKKILEREISTEEAREWYSSIVGTEIRDNNMFHLRTIFRRLCEGKPIAQKKHYYPLVPLVMKALLREAEKHNKEELVHYDTDTHERIVILNNYFVILEFLHYEDEHTTATYKYIYEMFCDLKSIHTGNYVSTMISRAAKAYNKSKPIKVAKQKWVGKRAYEIQKEDYKLTLKQCYAQAKEEYERKFGKPLKTLY